MADAGSSLSQDAVVSGSRLFGQIRPDAKQYPENTVNFYTINVGLAGARKPFFAVDKSADRW